MNEAMHDSRAQMQFRMFGRVMALWHGTGRPDDVSWNRALEIMRSRGVPGFRVLVWTEGGSPNARQRFELSHAMSGQVVPVAVVSDQAAVRFVVSALAFFVKRIQSFKTTDFELACRHLELTRDESEDARQFFKSLSAFAF